MPSVGNNVAFSTCVVIHPEDQCPPPPPPSCVVIDVCSQVVSIMAALSFSMHEENKLDFVVKKSASFAAKGDSASINLRKSLICVLLLLAALLTYQLKSHFEYAKDLTALLRIDSGYKD